MCINYCMCECQSIQSEQLFKEPFIYMKFVYDVLWEAKHIFVYLLSLNRILS
jgi:hypothetical protein